MSQGRIEKEKSMIFIMIDVYCKGKHQSKTLCLECENLHQYALKRLTFCKFGNEKTSCRKCPIHCYKKDMRIQIKNVMKYSGPRLIFYHPVEMIKHLFY